jgi:hypothetical protein
VGICKDTEEGAGRVAGREIGIGPKCGSMSVSILESRGSKVLSAMHRVTYCFQALKMAARTGGQTWVRDTRTGVAILKRAISRKRSRRDERKRGAKEKKE